MPAERLRGSLRLPADKSIAHRALLFSAMGSGQATVTIQSPGQDVLSTAAALQTLGSLTPLPDSDDAAHRFLVRGTGAAAACLPGDQGVTLDCGNSGTLMRLLAGAACTRQGTTTLIGDASLSARPMERVAAPLRQAGAHIATTDGHAPLTVTPSRITPHEYTLPVPSAQLIGALTLASLPSAGTTVIHAPGPSRDHTERMLAWLGVDISRQGTTTVVHGPAQWQDKDIVVPADPSAAAFWLVAGAVHPDAEITLTHVGLNPTRIGVIRVLQCMGADITVTPATIDGPEPAGDVTVRSAGRLSAVDLTGADVADVIDELPVLAIAMAAASGTSQVTGAGELRVKESDRIALTVAGLRALGVDATEQPDGWTIVGRPVERAATSAPTSSNAPVIATAADHRIAMAFAIADAVGVGACTVDDPDCAAVSYPQFFTHLRELTR